MKHLSIAALFAALLPACVPVTTPIKPESQTITTVFLLPGKNQNDIYIAAKLWGATAFNSVKATTQLDEPTTGTLVHNASTSYPCQTAVNGCLVAHDWYVPFTMTIETKPEKLRVTFTNIQLAWPPAGGYPGNTGSPVRTEEDMTAIKVKLDELGNDLARAIRNPQGNDW